ncbi:uncharacterized protein LOC124635998 [Helicoverpa zea]|uniref:uncharacterized protein LOC124635998 n=1 Tax=Helicoverpa zea TaxID=7113 RepID=UPI001F56A259|nr:uncharacterized protein LOC124635998 [Helicoverpa zea]
MASESSEKPASKSSLKELFVKRSSIKGQITKFKNYLDKVCSLKEISTIELAELDLKLQKFQGLSTRFDNIQNEIEVVNSSNIDSELDERERIEHDIVQYIAIAKTELQKYTTDDDSKRRQSVMIHADSDHQNIGFRLPQIQISKFNGSHFRWLEFRDTYLTGDIPKVPVDVQNLKIPKDIVLADPKFNEPAPVDMLIGADLFWDIIVGEQRPLGHHAVFKEDSESTKIRVVFDGSAPTASGYSLNDILMVGPNLQNSLFSILIRSRQYKYLLTGDIAKMYRQVAVSPEDCDLQLILWREDETHPIETLRLGTVTYGTASASYLSTRCLWQVGEECGDKLIKTIIQNDFLVDDVITGSDSECQLIYIQKALTNTLNSACFPLRKFKTNLPELFHNIVEINTKDKLTLSESSSTLGLGWDPKDDSFHIPVRINSNNSNELITKRFITSQSFKIFDPLGLISPCIIQTKILIQNLWCEGIDWDQPVPDDLKEKWYEISKNLPLLADLRIPRKVICDSPKFIELHSFCDASQVAYGACIYMRSLNKDNEVTVRLLCSKSKVAPVKPTTIPRLELCAAVLAANLWHFLIGRPLNALPTPAHDDCKATHVQRYARLQQIRRDFWNRWRREYISELQLRTKWKSNTSKLNIGDLVLLHEENVPPLNWRLGRVVRLFRGPDDIPRVADVNTSRGCVRRSLVRLCPLPSPEDLKVEA